MELSEEALIDLVIVCEMAKAKSFELFFRGVFKVEET